MFADWLEWLRDRGFGPLVGLILGSSIAWFLGRWKRFREKRSIMSGDARDTVVIHLHIVDARQNESNPTDLIPTTMRIRSLGQAELDIVVPNGHLAGHFLERAFQVTPRNTLISMEDAEGSYLLETLTNFVCDRTANAPFDHDLYVMAPCCEPAGLSAHQPITIVLISVHDLAMFEQWTHCRHIQVEHGSDGARVLTLMAMARQFKAEQEKIVTLRKEGKRTLYVETMYILDLPLDRRTAQIPTKEIPWGRYETTLKELNLE